MHTRPPMYDLLAASENRAVDDLLVAHLGELGSEEQVAALEVLIARGRPDTLEGLLERFDTLPHTCQGFIERHVHEFESVCRSLIRSGDEATRAGIIDLIVRSRAHSLAYVVASGLRHTSSETRRVSAEALRRMVEDHLDQGAALMRDHGACLQPEPAYRRLARWHTERTGVTAALSEAVAAYPIHLRTSVVEALLRWHEPLEDLLCSLAEDPHSKCWRAIDEKMRHDPEPATTGILMAALGHAASREQAAAVISKLERIDTLRALSHKAWMLGDRAVCDGARTIRRLSWLESDSGIYLELSTEELRGCFRLCAATAVPWHVVLQACSAVALSGDEPCQRIALMTMLSREDPALTGMLHAVSHWIAPALQPVVRRVLARRDGSANPARSNTERRRGALREIVDFKDYWNQFDTLDPVERREMGLRVLGQDITARAQLVEALTQVDAARRATALAMVRVLGEAGHHRRYIYEAATDNDPMVRSAGVRALPGVGGAMAERLLNEALEDPDRRVRANAVEALDELDTPDRADRLLPSLQDPDHRVRVAAAGALIKMRVPEAAQTLLDMLAHPSRAHRASGLWLIEQLGLANVVQQVQILAEQDDDDVVRRRARRLVRAAKRQRRRRNVELADSHEESHP